MIGDVDDVEPPTTTLEGVGLHSLIEETHEADSIFEDVEPPHAVLAASDLSTTFLFFDNLPTLSWVRDLQGVC